MLETTMQALATRPASFSNSFEYRKGAPNFWV